MTADFYDGGELLPADAFLRRLLVGHELTQRLRIEALVYLADSLKQGFDTMLKLAAKCGEAEGRLLPPDQTALFATAWRIVDNLDAARQLFAGLGAKGGSLTQAFMEAVQPARSIRNVMDHLDARIPNLAAAKGWKAPVLGSLSFVFVPGGEGLRVGQEVTDVRLHAVGAGSLVGGEMLKLVNPSGREIAAPVGMLTLAVFDLSLEIEPAVLAFKHLICAMSEDFERQVLAQVQKMEGADPASASEPLGVAPTAMSVRIPVRLELPLRIGFISGSA